MLIFIHNIFNITLVRDNGEYLCRLEGVVEKKRSAREVRFRVLEQCRRAPQSQDRPVILMCAPIKKPRMKMMIEKATELNISQVAPLITQNTNKNIDGDALKTCMVQATEQSERLSVPILLPSVNISEACHSDSNHSQLEFQTLSQINGSSHFFLVCCSRSDAGKNIVTSLQTALIDYEEECKCADNMPLVVVIGPEGGFTESDFDVFSNRRNVRFVSLGPNVLRAETAAIVALGCIHQSLGEV